MGLPIGAQFLFTLISVVVRSIVLEVMRPKRFD